MAEPTHEVFNQSEPLAGYKLFEGVWEPVFGTLRAQTDFDSIIERAMPR